MMYFDQTEKQLRYLKKVCKLMNLPWKPQAARPTDELTTFIRDCCDNGTPSKKVPELWLQKLDLEKF